MEFNEKIIGQRIKDYRNKMHLSQNDLSKLTDIATTQLSAYENGNKTFGLQVAMRISRGLNITLDELCFGTHSEQPITKAKNKGELIVNCVDALFKERVIDYLPREKINNYVFTEFSYEYKITFNKYIDTLEKLVKELFEFNANKSSYPNPIEFKKQILASAATRINKNK